MKSLYKQTVRCNGRSDYNFSGDVFSYILYIYERKTQFQVLNSLPLFRAYALKDNSMPLTLFVTKTIKSES